MSASRQMRRQMARQGFKHSYANLSHEQRKEALFKNGITTDDLERAQRLGFQEGFNDRTEQIFKLVYAAIVTHLHDKGLSRDEIVAALGDIDHRVTYAFSADEEIDRAYEQTGISIDFSSSMPSEKFTQKAG